MAKLPRSTQKIFAESATNNGVFGSLQAGTKQYSNDIATIQSLGAYTQGWNAATISSEKLPPLEEFQSLQYMITSQLAYIFQQGVPEWDSGTTYYQGSMVKVIGSNGDYALYASLTDNNIGNQVTDDVNWKLVYNTADPMQLISNMSQSIDTSSTNYPSNAAVRSFVLANALPDQTGHNGQFLQTNGTSADWTNVDLSPYQLISNIAQNLTSPSSTTYPSTQAVANESNRIISIMNNKGISSSGNNYIKFDNGLIVQWGNIPANTGNATYPISFQTTNNVVMFAFYNSASASDTLVNRLSARNQTTSGFIVTASTEPRRYLAIGY